MKKFNNWAGQYHCQPKVFTQANNLSTIASALKGAASAKAKLRVFGAGYSPSDIAMSNEHLLSIRQLNRIRHISAENCQAEVEAGITLRELEIVLNQHGMALPYHASVAEQTLAGAMATASHGTGLGFGVMPTWIDKLELMTTSGELLHIDNKDSSLFSAACCSLGCLGVHTAFKLNVSPLFDVDVEEQRIEPEDLLGQLASRAASADHYRLWYLPHARTFWEWRGERQKPGMSSHRAISWKQRLTTWFSNNLLGYHGFEFLLWLTSLSPSLLPAVNRGMADHFFRLHRQTTGSGLDQFTFDCKFSQYHNEWSIPLSDCEVAIAKLIELIDSAPFPVHLPIEIRFMGKDDIWLSPNQGRAGCHIGIIIYRPYGKEIPYHAYFSQFEKIMNSFFGRPHWGKMFDLSTRKLHNTYHHWSDFLRIRAQMDPNNILRNTYTNRIFEEES